MFSKIEVTTILTGAQTFLFNEDRYRTIKGSKIKLVRALPIVHSGYSLVAGAKFFSEIG